MPPIGGGMEIIMNKTLRMLALCLAALTLILCLAACGNRNETDDNTNAYTFKTKNGVTIAIGARHDDVIPKLGNYNSVNITDSCGGFSGKDRIYYYNGFRVYTTPSAKGDVINMIELTDDSVSTPEGLTIGSAKDDVTKAMGKGTAVGDNLSYEKGNMKLVFIFRDGTVTNIQYLAK